MINVAVLEECGLASGCDGCAANAVGRTARRGHASECRSRIEGEMGQKGDEQGILRKRDRKFEAHNAKLNHDGEGIHKVTEPEHPTTGQSV